MQPLLKNRKKNQEQGDQRSRKGLWKRSFVERELFVVCLLIFGASMSTIISSEDAIHFALTWSLATSRTIWLNANVFSGQMYTVQIGGHTYSALPPGLAFFTFVLVSVAQMITPMDPSASGVYIATYFSSIFAAFAAVLFFKTTRMFGSVRASAYLTIVFAFGTNLWIYSRIYLPEALATCLGLASVYCLLRAHQDCVVSAREEEVRDQGYLGQALRKKTIATVPALTFLSGLLLGITVFVDNVAFFFIIPIFLFLIFDIWPPEASSKVSSIISFIVGTLISFIPIWAYDLATTGSVFNAPYGDPFIGGVPLSNYSFNFGHGLYEALLSPGSGLILFTPFVLISLAGFYYLMRERLGESLFLIGLFVSVLVPISLLSESTYFLNNTIGPSELVIAMPYILLPAITVLTRMKQISLGSVLTYILAATSIVITGIIALTDPVPGPAGVLSGANGASPLITTNIPLFVDHSFLTWWSFFNYPMLYAILILVFPLVLLSYWTLTGAKIGRKQLKDLRSVAIQPVSRFGKVLRSHNRKGPDSSMHPSTSLEYQNE